MKEEQGFICGVVWALARLVEYYDHPSVADWILSESGISASKLSIAAEQDLKFLRKESPYVPKGVE